MENSVLVLVGLLGFVLGVPFLVLALAKMDVFFTLIKEGTAKTIVYNDEYNECKMRYDGFYIDEKGEVKKNENTRTTSKRLTGGLTWVGVWPFWKVYKYDFRWTTLKRVMVNGKAVKEIDPRDEVLDYIFVKATTYFMKLEEAETKGKFPVTTEFIITIRITNPKKALFRVHQWFEFVTNTLLPHLRAFQGSKTFDEINQMKQHKSEELFSYLERANPSEDQIKKIEEDMVAEGKTKEEIAKEIEERKLGVIGILRERCGVDIIAVGIEDLTPADEKYQEALAKQELAKLEAKRIETINKMIKKYGTQAIKIRELEALESVGKGPSNTILLGTGAEKNVSLLVQGGK